MLIVKRSPEMGCDLSFLFYATWKKMGLILNLKRNEKLSSIVLFIYLFGGGGGHEKFISSLRSCTNTCALFDGYAWESYAEKDPVRRANWFPANSGLVCNKYIFAFALELKIPRNGAFSTSLRNLLHCLIILAALFYISCNCQTRGLKKNWEAI